MSKAKKKSTAKSAARKAGQPSATAKQMALAARAAKAVTKAISQSKKGSGKRGKDDMDIHVHVGDVVMMGFDEAVDAEEWGARETNNEVAGKAGGRGKAAEDGSGKRRQSCDADHLRFSRGMYFRFSGPV